MFIRFSRILATAAALLALGACTSTWGKGGAEFAITKPAKVILVTDFGTVADGMTKDTQAIEKAIEAGAKAGGAIIRFPAGRYATGPLRLESNITLDLAPGSTLLFSTDTFDYPLVKTRWEGIECMNYAPLIYAYKCENVAITGGGTIDGAGAAWWDWAKADNGKAQGKLRAFADKGIPVAQRAMGDRSPGLRPTMLEFMNCKNVLIEGVTLTESPFWTVHPVYCENVWVRYVTIHGTGPNTDGVDPDSCKNVLIEHSTIDTADDCVAIKSGRDTDGRAVNIPCENVTVRFCTMKNGHAGVAIGSETAGSVRNVLVTDCTFSATSFGVRLKTRRGRGGVVEDVTYTNLAIDHTPQDAININMQYENPPAEKMSVRTPTFRNIVVQNITATDCQKAATIRGIPENPLEGLLLKNLKLSAKEGLDLSHANGITLENVKFNGDKGAGETFTNCKDVTVDGAKTDSGK